MTRKPYRPKYIPLYVSRTENKEPSTAKLKKQDITELKNQLDEFRQVIKKSPVSYPKDEQEQEQEREREREQKRNHNMVDPSRRFALPTEVHRFDQLRKGARRENRADIDLGSHYSRYRMDARQELGERSAVPSTRVARVTRDTNRETYTTRDSIDPDQPMVRVRKPPKARASDPEPDHESEHESEDGSEDGSEDESESQSDHVPVIRRYAGYNASGSPVKKVSTKPKSLKVLNSSIPTELERHVSLIEKRNGPEVAQQFLREYEVILNLLSKDYQEIDTSGDPVVKEEEFAGMKEEFVDNRAPKSDTIKTEYKEEQFNESREIEDPKVEEAITDNMEDATLPHSTINILSQAWRTTSSPLLLLITSFFFWQAIRLALTFLCLNDEEEFVRQQLVQGMSYAEIEQMWGLRGFNVCRGVWSPPVPR